MRCAFASSPRWFRLRSRSSLQHLPRRRLARHPAPAATPPMPTWRLRCRGSPVATRRRLSRRTSSAPVREADDFNPDSRFAVSLDTTGPVPQRPRGHAGVEVLIFGAGIDSEVRVGPVLSKGVECTLGGGPLGRMMNDL